MITVNHIAKAYGTTSILKDVSFSLTSGACRSLLGASGSGKSTLLKILAGLERADRGSFLYDGEELISSPAEKRSVVYLSQDPLLFPHMSVYDNIGYGLRVRKMSTTEINKKVSNLAEQLELQEEIQMEECLDPLICAQHRIHRRAFHWTR